MKHIDIFVYGNPDFFRDIAKKGTSDDMAFYNQKTGDVIVTLIEPVRFPDKIQPVCYALAETDYRLIYINELNQELGELLVAVDMYGAAKRGFIVVGPNLNKEIVQPLLGGTTLADYEFIEDDAAKVKELILGLDSSGGEGKTKIYVDHCFDVKSVGTVALGIVKRGSVAVHQNLDVLPEGKRTMVRSIQMQDQDHKEASTGARVGLSLRGIKPDDVGRGVLCEGGSMLVGDEIKAKVRLSKLYKDGLQEGQKIQFAVGMHYVTGDVVSVSEQGEGMDISIKLEKKISYEQGDRILMVRGDAKQLRVFAGGSIE